MTSRPVVLLAVVALSCGSTVVADAGVDLLPSEPDAGPTDAGSPDAGEVDAGRPIGPFVPATCTARIACSTPAVDVCAVLVDLRFDEPFTVTFDTYGSSWAGTEWQATCRRGTPLTVSKYASSKGKGTGITMSYDGECRLSTSSLYSGDSTESKTVASTISALSYQ